MYNQLVNVNGTLSLTTLLKVYTKNVYTWPSIYIEPYIIVLDEVNYKMSKNDATKLQNEYNIGYCIAVFSDRCLLFSICYCSFRPNLKQ
jgi:hypothetical protein